MSRVLWIVVSIVAGVLLGTLSNWVYDLLKQGGFFRDRPTVKRLIIIVLSFLPLVVLIALPEINNTLAEPPTPSATFTTTLAPTATFTTTPTPTATFTPTATSTATTTPTNTPTPANTPTPTSTNTHTPTETLRSTSTPSCPTVSGHFAAVWNMVQGNTGCAYSSAITGSIAEENFEGGKMFWREPIDFEQVLVLFNDGTWQIVKHSPFVEGSPEFSCPDAHTPSQCPPTPKRGFGMVWCDTPAIRSSLGNAIDCERGYQTLMQQFERGFMLQTDSGDNYVFYNNGQWERR